MLDAWRYIGIFVLVAAFFSSVIVLIPLLIAPHKPNQRKRETYECGIHVAGNVHLQLKVQYYIFALVFLIFDIETVFLYPWAVAFDHLPLYAVMEGILFITILLGGLFYLSRKGVLTWA